MNKRTIITVVILSVVMSACADKGTHLETTIVAQNTQIAQLGSQPQVTATSDQAFAVPTVPSVTERTALSDQGTGLMVTVDATAGWQDSGISLQANTFMTIAGIAGEWSACAPPYGCPFVGAEGWLSLDNTLNYPDNVIDGCPHSALVARIDGSEPFCANREVTVQARDNGSLQFRINDNRVEDNEGALSVHVRIQISSVALATVVSAPTGNSPPSFPFEIIPFGYTLEDSADGWMNGAVQLAFENTSGETIFEYPETITFPNGIVIETLEGVTYPGTLLRGNAGYGDAFTGVMDSLQIHYSGPIPPQFRFRSTGSVYFNLFSIVWKSAAAATPKGIVFPDHPEMNFDLPSALGTIVQFPLDTSTGDIRSVTSLEDSELVNDPNGVQATFTGQCKNRFVYYPDAGAYQMRINRDVFYLELHIVNNDKFNDQAGQFSLAWSFFLGDGRVIYSPNMGVSLQPGAQYEPGIIRVGPAQDILGYMPIFGPAEPEKDPPTLNVMWSESGYTVFDTAGCEYWVP